MTTYPGTEKNPWPARAKKFLIAGAVALVEIANVYANGPEWLYAAAAVAGSALVYVVRNAPEYKDPRRNRVS